MKKMILENGKLIVVESKELFGEIELSPINPKGKSYFLTIHLLSNGDITYYVEPGGYSIKDFLKRGITLPKNIRIVKFSFNGIIEFLKKNLDGYKIERSYPYLDDEDIKKIVK